MMPTVRGVFPQVIDSTMRGDLASCETKAYYGVNRRTGGAAGSVHHVAGGAFVRGLEVTMLQFYGQKVPLPDALQAGMLAAIEAYGDFQTPDGKENKGVDRVCEALAFYFNEAFPPATDHIQPLF